MGLKWGIFYRMRQLVIDSNKMMSEQGKVISEIHRLIDNCVMTKLDEHERHLGRQDEKINRIEEALKITVKK